MPALSPAQALSVPLISLSEFPPPRLSVEIEAFLTERALARFAGQGRPRAYGKTVIVGADGESEHGAAMIHPRLGLSMCKGLGAGPALIPGNAKVAAAGTPNMNRQNSRYAAMLARRAMVLLLVLGMGTASAKQTVKIAFIGPLTGGASSIGLEGRNSAQLAVGQHNANPAAKYLPAINEKVDATKLRCR